MNPTDYTEEQKEDINERVAKANDLLKGLDLRVQASISAQNVGDDIFGLKVIPYLQDIKYTQTLSDIQPADL